ncbi:hypothetical protein L596_000340 [Steinernema carpocapsae]|nr:hypothetical protein L596_000340 [Steinernema carpocapsae]
MVHVIQIPNSKKERTGPRLRMPNFKFYGDLPWIVVIVQSILLICILLFFFTFLVTKNEPKNAPTTDLPSTTTLFPDFTDFTEASETKARTEEPTEPVTDSNASGSLTEDSDPVDKHYLPVRTCSEIGRSILIRGGNAVESAIATLICSNAAKFGDVFGGGFIMTIYNSTTKQCFSADALPTAPSRVSETQLKHQDAPDSQFIATPASLNGFYRLFEKHGSGKVFWSELLMPTVDLCRRGFPVSQETARLIQKNYSRAKKDEDWKRLFVNPNTRKLYGEGDIINRYTYANSLEALAEAEDPVELFYRGDMAEVIANERRNDSFLAMNDLEDYETIFHGDHQVVSNRFSFHSPPPPSTFVLSQAVTAAVRELQHYSTTQDIRLYHNLIEVARKVELKRQFLGDEDYSAAVKDVVANISDALFANQIASLVRSWQRPSDEDSFERIKNQRTLESSVSVSVVDCKGNGVAVSSTNTDMFSTKTLSPTLGFIWNTQLRSFDLQPHQDSSSQEETGHNRVHAGQRPLSSMVPLLAIDTISGELKLALSGLDDSAMIASFLLRLLFFKDPAVDVVQAPQVSLGFANADILHDGRLSANTTDYLTSVGHRLGTTRRKAFSAIAREADKSLVASTGSHIVPIGY